MGDPLVLGLDPQPLSSSKRHSSPPPFLNLWHLSTSCQKFLTQVNKKWLTSVRNIRESISFGKMKELPGGAIRSMTHGSLWGDGLKGDIQGQGCPQDS